MQVPVAIAQVPVCWSVPRNTETILAAIGAAGAGTVLVLPEAALSGYDDQLSGLGDLCPGELAEGREVIAAAAPRPRRASPRPWNAPSTWPTPGTPTYASSATTWSASPGTADPAWLWTSQPSFTFSLILVPRLR